jgi:hypothetical protein
MTSEVLEPGPPGRASWWWMDMQDDRARRGRELDRNTIRLKAISPSRFGLGFPKKSLASTAPGFTSELSPNLLPTFTDGYILTSSRD